MRWVACVAGLAAWFAAVSGGASQAHPDPGALLERLSGSSDVAVVGRVASVIGHPHGPEGQPGIHSLVQVTVEEVLLGPRHRTIGFWIPGGRHGDRMRVLSHQSTFRSGERALVFLRRVEGSLWPTSMLHGKWSVAEREGARHVAVSLGIDRRGPSVSLVEARLRVAAGRPVR